MSYPTDDTISTGHDTVTNFAKVYSIISIASGDWSDPDTWDDARVPGAGDIVAIDSAHTVTYDVSSTDAILAVGVAGILTFRTDISTKLTVQNLLVYGTEVQAGLGELRIGTSGSPIGSSVTAEIVFVDAALIDPNDNPPTNAEYSNGLLCWGKLRVHGVTKTPFVRSTAAISASATTLNFSAQSGWANGDTLLIPDTRQFWDSNNFPFRIEQRTVSSIASTSCSVTAMTYDHPAAVDKDSNVDFTPHIANLTRNVRLRNEDDAGVHGHCICFNRCDVDIRYARFESLGRTRNVDFPNTTTNQKGRYALHLHHVMGPGDGTEGAGGIGYDATVDPDEFKVGEPENIRSCDGPTARVIGCTFEDLTATSPDMKWPLTIHNTCDTLIQGNVFYKGTGALMMFEDGTECYNVIDGNFLCYSPLGTGDRGDASFTDGAPGREGNGMSMPNCTNFVRNNVCYNISVETTSSGAGYHVYGGTSVNGFEEANYSALKIAEWQGADPDVDFTTSPVYPILEFKDNECCGCFIAYVPWYIGSTVSSFSSFIDYSVIEGFNAWHNRSVSYNFPCQKLYYLGGKWRGDPFGFDFSVLGNGGLVLVDYMQRGEVLDGVDIQNIKRGIGVPAKVGTDSSGEGLFLVQNCILHNYFNLFIETPAAVTGGGSGFSARRVEINNCTMSLPEEGDIGPPKHLERTYIVNVGDRPNINWVIGDSFFCNDIDGVVGDDIQCYWTQQASDFVTPQTSGNNIGSPDAGQTNAQNLAEHGVCIAGAISPVSTTRDGFDGFVEVIVSGSSTEELQFVSA